MSTLHQKLESIQKKVTSIRKTGYNKFQKYSYVQLQDILDALRPHLVGLTLTQTVAEFTTNRIESGDAFYTECSCRVETVLTDTETGELRVVSSIGYALDKNGDKAPYKAMTGGRKYGLLLMFSLDTNEDEPEDDKHESKQDVVAQKLQSTPRSPAKNIGSIF
jgi:hypothetical protein